jgi:hypothetical protein
MPGDGTFNSDQFSTDIAPLSDGREAALKAVGQRLHDVLMPNAQAAAEFKTLLQSLTSLLTPERRSAMTARLPTVLNRIVAETTALEQRRIDGLLTAADLGIDAPGTSASQALLIRSLQSSLLDQHNDLVKRQETLTTLQEHGDTPYDQRSLVQQGISNVEQDIRITAHLLWMTQNVTLLRTSATTLLPGAAAECLQGIDAFFQSVEQMSPIPQRRGVNTVMAQQVMKDGEHAEISADSPAGPMRLRAWRGSQSASSAEGGISLHSTGAVTVLDLQTLGQFSTGLTATLSTDRAGEIVTVEAYCGERLLRSMTVRDGEEFTCSDAAGVTAIVLRGGAGVRLSNCSVITRSDVTQQPVAPTDIAHNRSVSIDSARLTPFDRGPVNWFKNRVGRDGYGQIGSTFGYFIQRDPNQYTRLTLMGNDGGIFSGAPVTTLTSPSIWDSDPKATPLQEDHYAFIGNTTLLIYPGGNPEIWVPVNRAMRIGQTPGSTLTAILPPEGMNALTGSLVDRRVTGGDWWALHDKDLAVNQYQNQVGSFVGLFTMINRGTSGITVSEIRVHSGQGGNLADPVMHTMAGGSIQPGQLVDVSVDVPEGATVDGRHPQWTIGFVVNGKEYVFQTGGYRYPTESGRSATFNTALWNGTAPQTASTDRLVQNITSTVLGSTDSRIVYGRSVTGGYQVTLGSAPGSPTVVPSQLTGTARDQMIGKFMLQGNQQNLVDMLAKRYLDMNLGMDPMTAKLRADYQVTVYAANPFLFKNLSLAPLDAGDDGTMIAAIVDQLLPPPATMVASVDVGGESAFGEIFQTTQIQNLVSGEYKKQQWEEKLSTLLMQRLNDEKMDIDRSYQVASLQSDINQIQSVDLPNAKNTLVIVIYGSNQFPGDGSAFDELFLLLKKEYPEVYGFSPGENPTAIVRGLTPDVAMQTIQSTIIKRLSNNAALRNIILVGYSWGGGMVHDIADWINESHVRVHVAGTAYVDAFAVGNMQPERRLPTNSDITFNIFQSRRALIADSGLFNNGGAIISNASTTMTGRVIDMDFDSEEDLYTHLSMDEASVMLLKQFINFIVPPTSK